MPKPGHIALFGGTFNPIHNGHLKAAASAADLQSIDQVVFIPSFLPPHRSVEGGTTAQDRFAMVRLACSEDPRFVPSDFEISRKEKSYSITTVQHFLKAEAGAKINFLIGTDAFAEIDTWYRATDLLGLCDFLVMARPGARADLARCLPSTLHSYFKTMKATRLVHESGMQTHLVQIDGIELSSTEIRKQISQGNNPIGMVPDAVMKYIAQRNLYLHMKK